MELCTLLRNIADKYSQREENHKIEETIEEDTEIEKVNMMESYNKIEDYNKAAKFYQEAIGWTDIPEIKAEIYLDLAKNYGLAEQEEPTNNEYRKEGIKAFANAMVHVRETDIIIDTVDFLEQDFINLAFSYLKSEQYQEEGINLVALKWAQAEEDVDENYKEDIAEVLYEGAAVSISKQKYIEALIFYQKSLDIKFDPKRAVDIVNTIKEEYDQHPKNLKKSYDEILKIIDRTDKYVYKYIASVKENKTENNDILPGKLNQIPPFKVEIYRKLAKFEEAANYVKKAVIPNPSLYVTIKEICKPLIQELYLHEKNSLGNEIEDCFKIMDDITFNTHRDILYTTTSVKDFVSITQYSGKDEAHEVTLLK